jgi:RNA polymerase sigma-70 factor, ECF subfamily
LSELAAPERASDRISAALEQHRAELTRHCYRMLGSPFEAEDAVQETLIRAWRGYENFEGRAALRSWLYRIATNVCLDMLSGRERRARPMDLNSAGSAAGPLGDPLPEASWIEPIPDGRVLIDVSDPADVAEQRESIRLAFIAALQHLPPKQRAVLILREVLRWKAEEVAELLETSVQSVNSALQRARATIASSNITDESASTPIDDDQRELVARYVRAFESYDMDALTSVLHEDATWNMPPFELWLQTHEDVVAFCQGMGLACRGSRLIPVQGANGQPAFGQYKPAEGGGFKPWSLQVLEISGDRLSGVTFFLDTEHLFPLFGLPDRLDA